jgi:chaperone BCS1
MDRLLTDIRDFFAHEEYYLERGIPWRRGYLLHGVPGSGKTSTILAIASELQLDVYLIPLSNGEWKRSVANADGGWR